VRVKIIAEMMRFQFLVKHKLLLKKACQLFVASFSIMPMLYLALSVTSCKQHTRQEMPQKPDDKAIHKAYDRGPLSCTVDVDKSEMTIAERLNLTITIVIDENYDVELQAPGEKLAQFGIVDYHTSSPELTSDHKKKLIRSYVLEPFLSGDYTIPSMTIGFWKNEDQEKDKHTLETEEIKISVKSLLPENFKDMKLHDIQPPVKLPIAIPLWMWLAGICGITVVGLIIFVIYLKKRNQKQIISEKPLSPHELAYNQLEWLIAQNFIEKGEIKRFYYEITNILRRYVENRFGVNAPEQTTEEFLEGLNTNDTFPANYKGLLKNFLIHCDLVKFAAHHPTTDDIQSTFNSCRTFISETKITE
jgi:hypothetical protein